jgi:hypothetical protein
MQGHFFRSVFAFFLLLTIGCAPAIHTPALENADALRGKTIVLMRIAATEAGKTTNIQFDPSREPKLLRIANMDKWEEVLFVQQVGLPSPEVAEKGWIYLALDPGTYYCYISSTSDSLRFSVPHGVSLAYVGSFDLAGCTGSKHGKIDDCPHMSILDESAEAQEVARTTFSNRLPLKTTLAQKYIRQTTPRTVADLLPIGVETRGEIETIEGLEWKKRGASRATGIGGGWTSPDSGGTSSGGGMAGELAQGLAQGLATGIVMLYFMYLPVGVAGGALAGEATERKWEPCAHELARSVVNLDLATEQRQALFRALAEHGITDLVVISHAPDPPNVAADSAPKSLLVAEPVLVTLRECKDSGTYCIEAAFHVSLSDLSKEYVHFENYYRCIGARNVVRSVDFSKGGPRSYDQPVFFQPSIGCRSLDDFCGAEGKELLRTELLKATQAVSERMCKEWGLSE